MSAAIARRRVSRAVIGNVLVGLVLLVVIGLLFAWQPPSAPIVLPGADRLGVAALALLLYFAGCAGLWWQRRRRRPPPATFVTPTAETIRVVFASQTGRAEQLAQQTADALRSAGLASQLLPLSAFDPRSSAASSRVLFVASTTGEGDAPDGAYRFVREQMSRQADLSGLQYGVLALGDRSYSNFCAFGRDLDLWLQHGGAQALFDRVEVDGNDSDDGALRHWQQQLRTLAGEHGAEGAWWADWTAPRYQRWQLIERERLNAGSLGQPVFRLALQALPGEDAVWRAGDIAEIGPCNDPADVRAFAMTIGLDLQQPVDAAEGAGARLGERLARCRLPADAERKALRGVSIAELLNGLDELPHREYSIASLPADGRLELLLRQTRHSDGRLGHGSGWLTEWAPLGAGIALRVRRNTGFHLADDDASPLLMIGNGTGVAGLRAHWRARIAAGHRRNWLIFGERQRHCDFHFRDEIERAQRDGGLVRVDAVFSRDGEALRYVQDALRAEAERVRAWIADGATVLVCGSLKGMAPAVDAVLRETLGEAGYEALVEQGRYRRDVY